MFLSLRGTECHGNLGRVVAEGIGACVVFPCPLSAEIASLRSQRQCGVSEIASLPLRYAQGFGSPQRQCGVSGIASSLCAPGNERGGGAPRNDQNVTCSAAF